MKRRWSANGAPMERRHPCLRFAGILPAHLFNRAADYRVTNF
jgi:hypothetical protein